MRDRPSAASRQRGDRRPPLLLSPSSLRWGIGLLCAVMGALMLVTPHQLRGATYGGVLPFLPWLGAAFLVCGIALLALATLRPPQGLVLSVHLAAATVLLLQGVGFATTRAWSDSITFAVLGLGTGLGGMLPPLRRDSASPRGDLLSLLVGVAGWSVGMALVVVPESLWAPSYASLWPAVTWSGLALLVTGPPLAWIQVRPVHRPAVVQILHAAAGAALVSLMVTAALPIRAWTGIVLYGGVGGLVAVLPWLRRRFRGFDPQALRTRFALVLATGASVALILTVALVTEQEEHLARNEALQMQQRQADAIAQNIADFIELNGAHAVALATVLGLNTGLEQPLLEQVEQNYPDVTSFTVVDAEGRPLARTGVHLLDEALLRSLTRESRHERKPVIDLRLVDVDGHATLLLVTPVRDGLGHFRGALLSTLDERSLRRRLGRPDSRVYLLDRSGRLIAEEVMARRQGATSQVLEETAAPAGGRAPHTDLLVARARVPDSNLGWTVSVERPQLAALAGVRRGRDTAFILLAVVVVAAVAAGIAAARWVSRPLGRLAAAVDQLKAGNLDVPVASSNLTEVERLSAAFRELRDRLSERTRESERLAGELRARAEALAESDRRKDEFLAMLAHELRNPLGAISNASYLMEQPGVGAARMERSLAVIRRQTEHLTRLVDDLLDVSRITRGKVVLRRERVDLVQVVKQALDSALSLIESRGHRLEVVLPEEPLPVDADVTRLEQVLGNLLWNAAKFTPEEGEIVLRAWREGSEGLVSVRDSGEGIPPELLPRVFDLFTQGQQSLDRSGGGLGIGLTLVAQLVEMHGGTVEASSEGPGRGSEFLVRLPLAERQAEVSAPLSPGVAPRGEGKGILVVEDNRDAADMLALILRRAGHRVRVVHDGPAALEAFGRQRPQVVLLDLGLPGMDGFEVIRCLQAEEDLHGVLMVAVSGYGRDRDRKRAERAGFDRHLVKPVSPEVLEALLAEVPAGGGGG